VTVEVPPPLARAAPLLLCPHCGEGLTAAPGALTCVNGHSHDVAREGYVTLLSGPVGRDAGDDAAMIAARVEVEAAERFAPLREAIVAAAEVTAREKAPAPGASAPAAAAGTILDLGAGTGHHLAAVLDAHPAALGIAADVSAPACRRAARAHPHLAAVRADTWARVPLADAGASLALVVFAPRNGPELARVLRPGGTLLVAIPAAGHLQALREHHALSVHPDKAEGLRRQLGPAFEELGTRTIEWTLELTSAEAAQLLQMGPTARHLRPDALDRLAASPGPLQVNAAVELLTFRRT
jgi:23S rRNA (guanine745-N1)-methyltransferase